MKAIIMAGGEGARLRPLTCNLPKPMVPVMNKPVMEHIINLLKRHRITEIGVTTAYLSEKIKNYFNDGAEFGVNITYFDEQTPLGTAGSVKNAADFLDAHFLVISGDSLTDLDITAAIDFHFQTKSAATLVLAKVDLPLDYGVVITDDNKKIQRFVEKPGLSQVFSDTVNTGTYIIDPSLLSFIPDGVPFDFAKDMFPLLMDARIPMYGYVSNDYWCDIGDLNVYRHCHFDIFDEKVNIELSAREIQPGVYLQTGGVIEKGAVLKPPILIGKNAKIKAGAIVDSYTVVGAGSVVQQDSSLKRTCLWQGCNISQGSQIRGAVLCSKVNVRENASIYEQSIIGERSEIGENATIKPAIKLWPYKTVHPGAVVGQNMVWSGAHSYRPMFQNVVHGEINIDVTPETASNIGAALATSKPMGKYGISDDGLPSSAMIKKALTSGLLSSGALVYDFGGQALPVTRSGVVHHALDGAAHISARRMGKNVRCALELLNNNGANLTREQERKLAGIYAAQEFLRCEASDIKGVKEVNEYKTLYMNELVKQCSSNEMNFHILLQNDSEWGQKLLPYVCAALKCDMHFLKATAGSVADVSEFAQQCKAGDFDFGAIVDSECERILLCTASGDVINDDLYKALAALIVMKTHANAQIVVQTDAPTVIEQMAQEYNAEIIKSCSAHGDFMEKLIELPPHLAKMQLALHYDAVGALVIIMKFLKENALSLDRAIEGIPQFCISKREISCEYKDAGKVIRGLLEQQRGDCETYEGIKIRTGDGWVLIVPDEQRPVFKIVAESYSSEFAEEIAKDFEERVRELIKE